MNFSRREEAFRYEFPEALAGEFQISKVNGAEVESSSFGVMKVLDLSQNGAKICTEFDFQIERNHIELILNFQILSIDFSIPATLVYQESSGKEFVCGIQLGTDDTTREQITEELKSLAWKLVKE